MKGIIFLLILSFSIFGCSPIPKIEKNKITSVYDIKTKTETKEDSQKLVFLGEKWWTVYNDPVLDAVMDLTLKSNEDLKIAQLNIKKSMEAITLAKSQGGLKVDLNGTGKREKTPEHGTVTPPFNGLTENLGILGLDASYELDIFNRIGALSNEAEYKNQAVELNSKWIELNLSTRTARLYFYWIYLLNEEDILIKQRDSIVQLKKLEEAKYSIGNGIEDDVLKAENQLRVINSLIDENILNQQITINNLNLLSGNNHKEEIEKLLNSASKNNKFSVAIPDNVSSDVIVNRPDVSYYLAMINAQDEHLKSAKADFYPRFSIIGNYRFESIDFNEVLHRSSLAGFIGSSIYLPIFHMGAVRANYKVAGIDLNIFIEEYNKAVVNAYTEVNNELYKTKVAKSTLDKSDKNLLNEKNIFENNKKRFNIGTISKFQYVASTLDWLDAELQNKQQHFDFIVQQLNLIGSFGGTYSIDGENNLEEVNKTKTSGGEYIGGENGAK